jgi:hypothetical protein
MLDANPAADLQDLYAWTDGNNLELIMTVAGPVSGDTQYVFHVGRASSAMDASTGPAPTVTEIICVPETEGTNTTCWIGNPLQGGDFIVGDATSDAGRTSSSGLSRVHVGQHADPFYWYADGFANAVAGTQDVQATIDGNDYPEAFDNFDSGLQMGAGCVGGMYGSIAEIIVLLLAGDLAWNAGSCSTQTPSAVSNTFEGGNVDAIVVEVDTSLIAGTGDFFQVWASTHAG